MNSNDEEEQARAHSPIICSLLRLCNFDEGVESNQLSSKTKTGKQAASDEENMAARERVSSEFESYPATLVNVLLDAPCFKPTLDKFSLKKREKRTQKFDLKDHENDTLTIHVIGASEESELWGDFRLGTSDVFNAYTEALAELASTYKSLRKITLAFVGPNCPAENMRVVKTIDDLHDPHKAEGTSSHVNGKKRKREENYHKKDCNLIIETHRHNYELKFLKPKENHLNHHTKKKR